MEKAPGPLQTTEEQELGHKPADIKYDGCASEVDVRHEPDSGLHQLHQINPVLEQKALKPEDFTESPSLNITPPLIQRLRHGNDVVITCALCVKQGLPCNNKSACSHCCEQGTRCVRPSCPAFRPGNCGDVTCNQAHGDDRGLTAMHPTMGVITQPLFPSQQNVTQPPLPSPEDADALASKKARREALYHREMRNYSIAARRGDLDKPYSDIPKLPRDWVFSGGEFNKCIRCSKGRHRCGGKRTCWECHNAKVLCERKLPPAAYKGKQSMIGTEGKEFKREKERVAMRV